MSETGAGRAVIHDLGYKRYLGTRRAQSTRWQVVVRNLLRMSWMGWWRLKIWFIGGFIATVAFGAVLYVSQDKTFTNLIGRAGQLTFADALIPYAYLPPFFPFLAFVVSMTVGAGAIARDLSVGAFEFYFSRPVRPVDYLLGKFGGLFLIMWLCVGLGPLALSFFRLGLSNGSDELLNGLLMVGKVGLVGLLAAFAFAAVPLGFSAITANRKHTLALWAGYYFIGGGIINLVAMKTELSWLSALDLKLAIGGLSLGLFDFGFSGRHGGAPPMWAALIGLLGLSLASLALAFWRVRRAEREGLGGG